MAKILRYRWPANKYLILLTVVAFVMTFCLYHSNTRIEVSNHTFGIQTSNGTSESHVYLLIIIISDPVKTATRKVIRETWLSLKSDRVKPLFVIGSKGLNQETLNAINEEQQQFQDILVLKNIEDGYDSLTAKLKAALQIIHLKEKFNFLLKCDDDSFIRIPELVKALTKQPQEKLYWGFFKGGSSVFQKGKWKESDWFVCDTYLPYALGGGYVLSADLAEHIVKSSTLLQHYKSEDVSVGLWLSPLKIHRIHDVRFDTEFKSRGCFNSYLITHKQTITQMREKHANIIKTGKLCSSEERIRYSYNYNWNVPPSKCCKNFDPDLP